MVLLERLPQFVQLQPAGLGLAQQPRPFGRQWMNGRTAGLDRRADQRRRGHDGDDPEHLLELGDLQFDAVRPPFQFSDSRFQLAEHLQHDLPHFVARGALVDAAPQFTDAIAQACIDLGQSALEGPQPQV